MVKFLVGLACCGAAAIAQTLPVKRVVLYKNGVGYFEHVGAVRGNESVSVGFTSAQLNDVLKSLTVLDLSGGRITGVGYGSAAPADRQLAEMHLPAGEKASVASFLDSLRGSKVELKSSASVLTGRVLGVETQPIFKAGFQSQVQVVALLTDNGELRSMELTPLVSVRLLEPGLSAKMSRYLDVVSSIRATDERHMVISTAGSGERKLFVSYISEVPVWKSTYRVVLDDKDRDKATLQAWAIVDNTVGEDWNGVELSLVAGAPQSFVQNLSQPYYAKRPVIPLPQFASTTPQTHEGTLTEGSAKLSGVITDSSGGAVANAVVRATAGGVLVGQAISDRSGRYELDDLPEGEVQLSIESPGFQRGQENVDVRAGVAAEQDATLQVGNVSQGITVQSAAPSVPKRLIAGTGLGDLAYRPAIPPPPPAATGQELGDLFEYKLDQPITIAKNRSALVPIAQASLTAEKVSLWNETAGGAKPQRALWFTNSSKLTLDGGTVSVSDGNAFAGEGVLESIRPGEKRLFSYAADLALNISSKSSSESQRVTRVFINRGVMRQESEIREKKIYTVRNTDTQARQVIVEHPLRSGYELRGDSKPLEATANFRRFALPVAAASTASLTVEEARQTSSAYAVTNITPDQVAVFVRAGSIDPAIRAALEKIVAQKKVIADLESQKQARAAETQKIFDDQQRLRENIKALRGTPEEKSILQRYTAQLTEQENRLPQLDKETVAIDNKTRSEKGRLNAMVEELSFDARL